MTAKINPAEQLTTVITLCDICEATALWRLNDRQLVPKTFRSFENSQQRQLVPKITRPKYR